ERTPATAVDFSSMTPGNAAAFGTRASSAATSAAQNPAPRRLHMDRTLVVPDPFAQPRSRFPDRSPSPRTCRRSRAGRDFLLVQGFCAGVRNAGQAGAPLARGRDSDAMTRVGYGSSGYGRCDLRVL